MAEPEDVCRRFWSLPQKPDEEARRETLFLDDIIHKAHLDREIARRLDGVTSVLDVGAGTGRFSIPLAGRGLQVTHLDISEPMIERAREEADRAGVRDRMDFRVGHVGDLEFEDRRFDLVLCADAPISYAYPYHERALAEVVRVARRAVVVSVSSRLGYIHLRLNPAQKEPYLADPESEDPLVRFYTSDHDERRSFFTPDLRPLTDIMMTGLDADPEETSRDFEAGQPPWPHNYLFMPDELADMLAENGVVDVRLSGPGALSRGLPNRILRQLLLTDQRRGFLDLCHEYDSQPAVCGLGKDNLVASGWIGSRDNVQGSPSGR